MAAAAAKDAVTKAPAVRALVFDVETTGLPRWRDALFKRTEAYDTCRVLSVSWIVVTEDAEPDEAALQYRVIRPEGWTVAATEIHGITQEAAERDGVAFMDVWAEMRAAAMECEYLVGHNIQFDLNAIRAELWRRGRAEWKGREWTTYCTMRRGREILGLGKHPRLGELYERLVGKAQTGAHNARADTWHTALCWKRLWAME